MKVTVVGDGAVGKTCLLVTHVKGVFPEEYVPTVFDNFKHEQVVENVKYVITLWDTAGQEEYEKLRPLSYPNTSVFILCFSLNSRSSFENISRKWIPELKAHSPQVPIILVGTKLDVRELDKITEKDGAKLCSKYGLMRYIECSSRTGEGLKEVFELVAKAAAGEVKKSTRTCCIL
ncbi:Small GTP-binding protein domain [Trinorchestia longiramus]|nr:Small GTP-binding protein domain [Trinorchestia longiramus]